MENKRATWGSTFGFLMAAVGSAVGLGNIWGFPYKMGANGGFAFLVLYLILGCWRGYVALFEKGKEEPRQIFPCLVDTLPEKDQQILKDGLPIYSQKALQEALEDYLS